MAKCSRKTNNDGRKDRNIKVIHAILHTFSKNSSIQNNLIVFGIVKKRRTRILKLYQWIESMSHSFFLRLYEVLVNKFGFFNRFYSIKEMHFFTFCIVVVLKICLDQGPKLSHWTNVSRVKPHQSHLRSTVFLRMCWGFPYSHFAVHTSWILFCRSALSRLSKSLKTVLIQQLSFEIVFPFLQLKKPLMKLFLWEFNRNPRNGPCPPTCFVVVDINNTTRRRTTLCASKFIRATILK